MFLLPLHLPLIPAGYFGGVIQRMLDFVSLRVRRSDQGMTPSLSPGLRAQTVALHRRLAMLAGEFHRLARLAREGRLRVYPDRRSPAGGAETSVERGGVRSPAALDPALRAGLPVGPPPGMAHGAMLPALPTRGRGWMLGFVPAEYRDALAGLLRNPEMVSLIGASSSVARLLRSLCHGLGVIRPEGVFPARHRRRSRAARQSRRTMDGSSDERHLQVGAGPGGSSPAREPAIVMSAQARDRWWAGHRGGGCPPGDAPRAGVGFDTAPPGRCAKI